MKETTFGPIEPIPRLPRGGKVTGALKGTKLPPKHRCAGRRSREVVYAGPSLGGRRHLVIDKASERHLVTSGVNGRGVNRVWPAYCAKVSHRHRPTSLPSGRCKHDRGADGHWIAEVPELAGVMVYGSTREEAIARAEALALRVLAEHQRRRTACSRGRSAMCREFTNKEPT